MTLKVRQDPPVPNAAGYCSPSTPVRYQFGMVAGLQERLAKWSDDLRNGRLIVRNTTFGADRNLPVAAGLPLDLEVALQLLNLREFAEWLKTHGPPDKQEFADDILADQETLEAVRQATNAAGYRHIADPVRAIERMDDEGRAMRAVLVETGALSADDTTTPLPDLLRALLS